VIIGDISMKKSYYWSFSGRKFIMYEIKFLLKVRRENGKIETDFGKVESDLGNVCPILEKETSNTNYFINYSCICSRHHSIFCLAGSKA
jgi:hypothetical protein